MRTIDEIAALGVRNRTRLLMGRAAAALRRAVEAGEVIRLPCEVCGSKRSSGIQSIGGHHVDYLLPLKVIFLCHSCHQLVHLAVAAAEESLRNFAQRLDTGKACAYNGLVD